jgi:hypothetical protein
MLTVTSRARASIRYAPSGRSCVESDGKASAVGERIVSDEVIGFEFERSRLLAHESEGEAERPVSAPMPGLLLQPGLTERTSHTFKATPSEPDDEYGGLPSRSLPDPHPKIPELYYG